MTSNEPVLLRDRHIKYWLRCAKTFLPEPYTSNDSNRMTLAFFIVSALDLLDLLDSKIDTEERNSWIDWIYSCQLDSGGFRGFTGTKLDNNTRTLQNQHWDPSNVPATFFALVTLIILGDDLSRVKRRECLAWLSKVQRENGSFGETLGESDKIEGGSDLRFCCCAAGIRHVLRAPGDIDVQDFDVDRLVAYIAACQVCS
jgi:geranylgeranyl transferase type-1 subunit beta